MTRILITAKNRHFPKCISLREAITLHAQSSGPVIVDGRTCGHSDCTTVSMDARSVTGGHYVTAPEFSQPLAGAALAASAQGEQQ